MFIQCSAELFLTVIPRYVAITEFMKMLYFLSTILSWYFPMAHFRAVLFHGAYNDSQILRRQQLCFAL